MSLTSLGDPDESTLIRYLVGRAPEEETERLDELSTVDEPFAVRLRAVEHDLVDAYVNGELTGDTLEGFRAQYLRSPAGLAAVEFAEALRGYRRAPLADLPATPPARARLAPFSQWQSVAALLLIGTSAWLLVDNLRLRDRMADVSEAQAALAQRALRLEEDLSRQQSAARATVEELARVREALAAVPERAASPAGVRAVLALALAPLTRSGGVVPQVTIPKGVHTLVLRLPLVAVEFAQYEAALRETTSERLIWRSGRLRAPAASDQPALEVTVQARLLEPRAFTLELSGISGLDRAEPLDTYPFRVVP